jgi:MSHA biogenesis protein MshO
MIATRIRQNGFTLIEIVVAITISAIVMVFVSMFIAAPLHAYDAQSRRTALIAGPSDAWPRMEADLRTALPNSVRVRRNGVYVVVEMLPVIDSARYMTAPGASFTVAGTAPGTIGGVFRGIALPFDSSAAGTPYYLNVNSGVNPYTTAGVMTGAATIIRIAANGTAGEATVTLTPAPALTPASPRHRVFLLGGPVTYLCDEGQGTLSRYSNYPLAANQASWDAPTDFSNAGVTSTLMARGLTTCNFAVSAVNATTSQTVAVRLNSTATNGDSVTLLHTARAGYVP